MKEKGIYITQKTDKSIYYRVSVTYLKKHISLDSFDNESDAINCRKEADRILSDNNISLEDYRNFNYISFEKFVVLINFRDNKIYIRTPIYLKQNFFYYCLSPNLFYKFDKDDLFYYSNHKIMKRGNHLFVYDYGMQINIFERYNIPSYSVYNKDYRFINDDPTDFRYENIEIINPYYGVSKKNKKNKVIYIARIHINGYTKIGEYKTITEAAIAYNKACDYISQKNGTKYLQNYPNISPKEYAEIYSGIELPDTIKSIVKK